MASPVLVTGGTGRLGTPVAARLLESDCDVRVLARRGRPEAASRAGAPHLAHVSIVGIEHMASWGYLKAKLQAEHIVAGSGVPWTILRATQFYDYCLTNLQRQVRIAGTRAVRNGGLLPPPGHTEGARTWDQFLATRLRHQAATTP